MPTTTNLGLAVSSNPNDSVYEYWTKMLNTSDGNFVIIDNEFGILATEIPFSISNILWLSDEQGPFKVKAVVTLTNTLIRDDSTVEAYFTDIINSAGIVLTSVVQSGSDLVLTFYANEAKSVTINGVLKYVY